MQNTIFIDTPKDFSFRSTVYSHGWCELAPFNLDVENWRLSYVFRDAKNKDLDVGLIYTLAAGLLNLLVIYDAAAGPAFHDDKTKPEPKEKLA